MDNPFVDVVVWNSVFVSKLSLIVLPHPHSSSSTMQTSYMDDPLQTSFMDDPLQTSLMDDPLLELVFWHIQYLHLDWLVCFPPFVPLAWLVVFVPTQVIYGRPLADVISGRPLAWVGVLAYSIVASRLLLACMCFPPFVPLAWIGVIYGRPPFNSRIVALRVKLIIT